MEIKCSLNIPSGSLLKVRGMVKDCCNYYGGECGILDCDCVVMKDANLNCLWYINAVLPTDVELNKVLLEHNDLLEHVIHYNKKCKNCDTKFQTENKTTQYCPKCSRKKELERKKAYKYRQKTK